MSVAIQIVAAREQNSGTPQQMSYTEIEKGVRKFIIVEFFDDGPEKYAESEVGEVRWFRRQPSPEEIQKARRAFAAGRRMGSWDSLS